MVAVTSGTLRRPDVQRGLFLSLFSLMGAGAAAGAIFGIGAVILLPLLYGIIGFVVTLIGAWIYNAAAKRVGGIEIQTE